MYPKSAECAGLLRQSHSPVAVLDVLHGGRAVAQLAFTGGTVNVQGGRSVTRNFSGTVIDPSGGTDIAGLFEPFDCEVMPRRGVLLADGSWELAPQGVFRLTKRDVGDLGTYVVSGQDRAVIYQGPMDNAVAISGGTPIETAIRRLLVTRNRNLVMHDWVTGFTCGPLLYPPDANVWDEALDLAKSVGGILQHDRNGELVFEPGMPVSDEPSAIYAYGGGVLLDATRSEDYDTVRNVVVVESSKAGYAGVIRATAEDTDPISPTYAGRLRRPVTLTNQHVGSIGQAQQMAATELARVLGRSEETSVTVVPDPFIDANDVILTDYPAKGIYKRSMIVAGFSVPLTVDAPMTLQCRRSLVGRDGRLIDIGSADGN
jgi:hypothetical protein